MCPGHLTSTAEPDTPQDLTENTRKWETDQEIFWSELLPSAQLQRHQDISYWMFFNVWMLLLVRKKKQWKFCQIKMFS